MRPPGLVGIHLNMVMYQPTQDEIAQATPEEQRMLADAQRYERELSGYMKVQSTRPQSIGFALSDSPVGLAAWIYALFQDASDSAGEPEQVIDINALIDDVMLYWLPNAGPSSVRFYWEGRNEMQRQGPAPVMPVPAGVSMFPGELLRLSRRWAQARFADLQFFTEAERGGHFAAMENPTTLAGHIRETFRVLR